MKIAVIIIFGYVSLLYTSGYSQCLDRDSLWNRLLYLTQVSSSLTKADEYQLQLKELLSFETSIKSCGYRNDSTHALLLQRIGVMYARLNDYVKAIDYTNNAATLIKLNILKYPSTAKYLVKDYYNLSSYYGALKKLHEKMALADSCINTAIRFNAMDYYSLFVLAEKVNHYIDIGDYTRCYQYAEMGMGATAKVLSGADSIAYHITFFLSKIDVLIALKKYNEAEMFTRQQTKSCEKANAAIHLGALYDVMGRLAWLTNNTSKAITYYEKAFQLRQRINFNLGCMQTLNNMAFDVYDRRLNNMAQSLKVYQRALSYNDGNEPDKTLKTLESLTILANIGSMYSRHEMFDSAFHYFQLAFNCLGKGINENSFIEHPSLFVEYRNVDYLVLLVIDKGNSFLSRFKKANDQQYITEAIRIYKIADRMVNMLKSEQSEIESRLFWRGNTRMLYEHAIEACFLGNRNEDAFYFMEKSRAVLLNDQLNLQHILGSKDILMQSQLNRKIASLQKDLNDITMASHKQSTQQELLLAQLQRDHITEEIKHRNPLYYQCFLDTGFVTITGVQQILLKDKQALLELFTGDSAVYIIVVTSNQTQLSKINKQSFSQAVSAYISFLSNPDTLNLHFKAFTQASYNLYNLIFHQPLPAGRIIISPDAAYIPFEALIKDFANAKPAYFVEDYAVSYTYSARYLLSSFNDNKYNSAAGFIGLAPSRYAAYMQVADLPGSIESLKNVADYFSDAQLLLSSKASKNNFLETFSKYKIVQLYTHASDSAAAGEPVMYFADSALRFSELMPENKPLTELVVLSACETGSGKLYRGEGIFSFNRGFAALGIPSSLANLWSVDNESTYRLTELFYQHLSEGQPSDVALQKAKLDFLKKAIGIKQLPYYWAAPVITGKAGAFMFEKKYFTASMILPLCVMMCAIFFMYITFKTNRLTAQKTRG